MSSPPKNIPPDELWAEINTMPRPHRVVDFPRMRTEGPNAGKPVGQVTLAVLFQDEGMKSSAAAEKHTRAVLKEALNENVQKTDASQAYDDIYNNASVDEVLFRATRRADDPNAFFFPSPSHIRQKLTQEEAAVLFRQYLILKSELGPIVAEMSHAEMLEWVAQLVEGGSSYPLARLSSDGQTALLMGMASLLASFLTATSYPGWRLEKLPTTPEAALVQELLAESRPKPLPSSDPTTTESSPSEASRPSAEAETPSEPDTP